MFLIQLLLPLYDNSGIGFPHKNFETLRDELAERFGGVTAFLRSPAQGLWKASETAPVHDDIVIYEVMTESLERKWWESYRKKLEADFRQNLVIIRVNEIELL